MDFSISDSTEDRLKSRSAIPRKEGARVAILTDGDMTGRAIAGEVRDIPRIGISLENLEMLDIPINEVAEDLDKDSPHKKSAEKLLYQRLILEKDWRFLNGGEHGRRVEIDNVIGYVGTQRFWNEFVLPSFAVLFPKANYNLTLNRIEYIIPPQIKILTELSQKKGTSAAIDEVQNLELKYSNYDISSQGFISDITVEEQRIEKIVMEKELEDNDMHWLSVKLESLNNDFSRRTGIKLPPKNMKGKENADNHYVDMCSDNIDDVKF